MRKLHVHPDHDALVEAAADFIAEEARAAVASAGRFNLVLAGGSTPAPIYARLASPEYFDRVRWAAVHVFFGDERCVPPEDERSNYGMARDALLARVPIPAANVHRILGEADPAEAATEYERVLRKSIGGQGVPNFDLICLGMGDNGHTASLFPESPVLEDSTHWVMPAYVEEVGAWRVTMTPVILNASHKVLFLVEGAGKAVMLRRVLRGPHQPRLLPAQLVDPEHGEVHWLVDAAAAGELDAE
jgi:6-phosphogluconolactonase